MRKTVSKQPSQEEIETILRGTTIPSPPQVIVDLQMEMAMPDPDINAIAKLIADDAGLAGGVLKTINSGIYGDDGDITSISKAVMLLGMNSIMRIIDTLCLRNEMMNMDNIPDQLFAAMNGFWDSATEVAHCSVMIAHKLQFSRPDHAYALGLFHNVGVPLLMLKFEHYAEVMRESYEKPGPRIVDTENRLIDTNHAVLGFFVARSSKLPKNLCQLIAQHHNVEIFQGKNSLNSDDTMLLAILKVAEHISGLYRAIGGQPNNPEWNLIGKKVLEYAGLSQIDLDDLIDQARDSGLGELPYFM